MTPIHLEVTYEDGLPSVAYLYLPRDGNDKSHHCVQAEPDLVLDINDDGKLIGIEILSPELVTLHAINAVLGRYGLDPLGEVVLKPLLVTQRAGSSIEPKFSVDS